MKRLPIYVTAATFAAIAAMSASCAYWGMQLFKEQQRPIAAPPPPPPQEPSVAAARSLFGGDIAVAAASNYQLKGVVAAANGRHSVAIIAADGQPAKAYPVGADVGPGVKVQEVQPRFVMLSEGGMPKRLDLPAEAPGSGGGSGITMAPPIAQPSPPPQLQTTPPPQPQQPGIPVMTPSMQPGIPLPPPAPPQRSQ